MVRSAWKQWWRTFIQDVTTSPTSIYIDLVEVQVRRAHIGLLVQCTTSTWHCVRLYSPDQTIPSASSSNWSKGQMAVQSAPCQIYSLLKALRHILTFFNTLHNWVHPPLRDASLSPTLAFRELLLSVRPTVVPLNCDCSGLQCSL